MYRQIIMEIKDEYVGSTVSIAGISYVLDNLTTAQMNELLELGQTHLFKQTEPKKKKKSK